MSHIFDSQGRPVATGDGAVSIAEAPGLVRRHEVLVNPLLARSSAPTERRPEPKAIEKAADLMAGKQKDVTAFYESSDRLFFWGLCIIGLISVSLAVQITLTVPIVDIPWLNWTLAIGTVGGLVYGLILTNALFKGLRAGAFIGIAKMLAWGLLIGIGVEEAIAMASKFNEPLMIFYFRYIGPACLVAFIIAAKVLVMLKTDEHRARKLHALHERTQHNMALREIRIPEREEKAKAKADAAGSFAALVARWKLVFLASIISICRGWIIAFKQANAMAIDKHEETGATIASYEKKKKKRGGSRAKK